MRSTRVVTCTCPGIAKGTLDQSVCVLTSKRSAQRREKHRRRDRFKVIDWLISHPPARTFEGVSGRGMRRSQQRGKMFGAVSYTYLGGGMQPPGCRRLRVWIFLCVVLRVPACVIRVGRARLQPFLSSGSCIVQCRCSCDVGLLTVLR